MAEIPQGVIVSLRKVAILAVVLVVGVLSILFSPTPTPHQLAVIAAAILGHFVGDYIFQNQWMAIGKSQPGKLGHIACTVHVLSYTFAVAMFTGWHPLFLFAVAVPHWIIDRWSLAIPILRFKNGFDFYGVWNQAPLDAAAQPSPYVATPITRPLIEDIANGSEKLQLNVWKVAFAAPVYIFNDNTLHWVCLWFTCMWFFR
jgi:hypothetical protein